MPLSYFIRRELRLDPLYFILHARECIAHARNQKRLDDERGDPRAAAYVNALFAAGDLK